MAKKATKRKSGLGRGLGALLEDSADVIKQEKEVSSSHSWGIPIDQVETNPYQPRTDFDQESLEELAESIKVQGIIQPITVRKLSQNAYQLISGERRLQASKIVGLKEIPAYIREANDQQMLEMALIENIQRENLNPIEVAISYQRLMSECDLKQEELGGRVGKKRATVSNYLRLLKLPPVIQAALKDQRISMGHARALITISEPAQQITIFNKMVREGLSVRKVEELVRALAQPKKRNKPTDKSKSVELKHVEDRLSTKYGTKIQINGNDDRGEIRIPYLSTEDLNRLLELLNIDDI